MRRIQIRALSLAAIATLAFSGTPTAQDKPSALLNTLEVQRLVARALPADHARLGAHFAALADGSPPTPNAIRQWRRASLAT